MAHFAEIDGDGIVLRVCVVSDDYEADGENWCADFWGGTWKQCSYNANIRKQFPGVGDAYDAAKDKFIKRQPFSSWALDGNDDWQAPSPRPEGGAWNWDEASLSWKEII